jgi:hypothetical protein
MESIEVGQVWENMFDGKRVTIYAVNQDKLFGQVISYYKEGNNKLIEGKPAKVFLSSYKLLTTCRVK